VLEAILLIQNALLNYCWNDKGRMIMTISRIAQKAMFLWACVIDLLVLPGYGV
jgi:hypothetical protein